MKKLIVKTAGFVICFIAFQQINAQSAIVTAGGNAGGDNGSASYTIGQALYTTDEGESLSISKGIQAVFEVKVIPNTSNKESQIDIKAYPNPVTEQLTIDGINDIQQETKAHFYNSAGLLIKSVTITKSKTEISISEFDRGNYVMRIENKNEELISFKIIKK